MAPVVRALAARVDEFRPVVCVTNQHQEMLDQVLDLFELRADHSLQVMTSGQTPNDVTVRVLERLPPVLASTKPAAVLVQGDTTTTFAAALAAFYARIPIGHVEAGLRTYRKDSPFPEELNRQMTTVLADWHYAPTAWARDNLLRAGVAARDRHRHRQPGDRRAALDRRQGRGRRATSCRSLRSGSRMILVTAHRRENFGAPFVDMCEAMRALVERHPDVELVYPVHLNPNVQEPVRRILAGLERVHLLAPVDYATLVALLKRCELVLTDSGGIQEEAPSLGKPVLGHARHDRAAGGRRSRHRQARRHRRATTSSPRPSGCSATRPRYAAMAHAHNPYGDGHAGEMHRGNASPPPCAALQRSGADRPAPPGYGEARAMNDARPSFGDAWSQRTFRDPVGLARRILRSRDRAAYFAVASTALAAIVTPLDQLLAATVEKTHLRDQAPTRPVILVTGAPRSGTTVLSQALIHHLPVAYFNNLTAVFPRAPISANTLFGRLLPKPAGTLHSFYGRTSGFASENDGLHLWDRWLGPDRYAVPERLDERAAADPPALLCRLRARLRATGAEQEQRARDRCGRRRRGAPDRALHLHPARSRLCGAIDPGRARDDSRHARSPYGVTDPVRRQRVTSPIEDVCAQVLYHERRMEEERRIIGDERFWIVDYEQFCIEPHAIVVRVAREILGVDVDVDALRAALPPLRNTNRSKLPAAELDEIERTLARLRSTARRASSRRERRAPSALPAAIVLLTLVGLGLRAFT